MRAVRFGVFAECLLTGVWIALASLPLVTLPAALAAGSAHLRRHLAHEPGGLREFATDVRAAARHGGLLAGLTGWAALALVWADIAVVRAGGLPGGAFAGAVGVLALLALSVAGLRAAVAWHPGAPWRPLLTSATRRTVRDPAGSLALVCGFAVIAASMWFSPPLAAPALGILTAAALAVEQRADA
ncbi:hypothetical protein QWM81_27110 [Streptomyces ficellus]|uniref:DUF624 domain-containing protein n=1 Tax=Streptomyces ficellus TaxID=1977088 RepID=A0ABT7ZF35_9ACTN|nr:hypothetical protein [Streptomyces ficellus]MDN3297641.1 hypothetical protein [Streptomyces ficellus]